MEILRMVTSPKRGPIFVTFFFTRIHETNSQEETEIQRPIADASILEYDIAFSIFPLSFHFFLNNCYLRQIKQEVGN